MSVKGVKSTEEAPLQLTSSMIVTVVFARGGGIYLSENRISIGGEVWWGGLERSSQGWRPNTVDMSPSRLGAQQAHPNNIYVSQCVFEGALYIRIVNWGTLTLFPRCFLRERSEIEHRQVASRMED